MFFRSVSALAAAFLSVCAMSLSAMAEDPVYQKIPSKGTTFEKKADYWYECRDTSYGQVCETIYMRAKDGSHSKLAANDKGMLKRKGGQVLVCYEGSHNAQVCYWAYTARKAQ
jgi:hypothetical protein